MDLGGLVPHRAAVELVPDRAALELVPGTTICFVLASSPLMDLKKMRQVKVRASGGLVFVMLLAGPGSD